MDGRRHLRQSLPRDARSLASARCVARETQAAAVAAETARTPAAACNGTINAVRISHSISRAALTVPRFDRIRPLDASSAARRLDRVRSLQRITA